MAKSKRSAKGWCVARLRPEAAVYSIRFRDHAGVWRRLAGFSDEIASDEYGRKLRRLAECRISGTPLSPELLTWARGLDEKVRARLEGWGLIDPQATVELKGLADHVADWYASIVADGGGPKHAAQQVRMVREIVAGVPFTRFVDIDAGRVKVWLAGLGKSMGTANHYRQAMRQFCSWMVDEGRAPESPVGRKRLRAVKVTDGRRRRALSRLDLAKLIMATGRCRSVHGQERMTGPHRACCYLLAVTTGLRAAELRSLRRGSFDLEADPPTVTVAAAYAKGRREDTLAIPARVARFVRPWVEASNGSRVFPLPRHTAIMMRRDLEAAGLPFVDEAGRRFDFHCLRVQTAIELERGKAGLKVRQDRMRHSNIGLTMNVYTQLGVIESQEEALKALPG